VDQRQLYGIARALLLAGGVVAIVLGGLGLLGAALRGSVAIDAIRDVIGVLVGVLALATMSQNRSEAVEIVLIVLGLISSNAGGFLVALAGIIGLVARYTGGGPQPAATAPVVPV
jgi:hypothetical protein